MLYDKILADYRGAMRDKDEVKKIPLSYLLAQIKNKQIEIQKELEDEDIVPIIKKEIKARQESIQFLKQANRQEWVIKEERVIAFLSIYLPPTLSEEELTFLVEQVIDQQGITDIARQRGEIVKAIMADHKASVDGALLQQVIGKKMQ